MIIRSRNSKDIKHNVKKKKNKKPKHTRRLNTSHEAKYRATRTHLKIVMDTGAMGGWHPYRYSC